MIVTPRVVPPVALLVALVCVTVTFDAGIAEAPRGFFGEREDLVLILPDRPEVSSTATVPESLVDPLRSLNTTLAVSPEIVVMTSWAGASVFARGVLPAQFLRIEHATVREGTAELGPDEALAGASFARRLDLRVGDRLVLTGSLEAAAISVRIAGVFAAEGAAVDELLLTLPMARALAALPADGVHLIRVQTTDKPRVAELLTSARPSFTFSDARIEPTDVVPGELVTFRANLTNWGAVEGAKDVVVNVNGAPAAHARVSVPARASVPVALEFEVEDEGIFNVTVNPTLNLTVRPQAAFLLDPPPALVQDRPTTLRVGDADAQPLEGVRVVIGNHSGTADDQGHVVIAANATGFVRVTIERDGEVLGTERLFVAARESAGGAKVRIADVKPPARLLGAEEAASLTVAVENVGSEPGEVPLRATLGDEVIGSVAVFLSPGERREVLLPLAPLGVGRHAVRVEDAPPVALEVVEGDPRVEEAVRAREALLANPGSQPRVGGEAASYVNRIVRSVAAAATAISLAAGALATLGALATWSRHLGERSRTLGVLKSLGASRAQVETMALREALLVALAAAASGVAGGIVLALGIDQLNIVRAFGHQIHPVFDPRTLGILAGVSVIANVLVVRQLVAGLYRRPADDLLRAALFVPPVAPTRTLEQIFSERGQ